MKITIPKQYHSKFAGGKAYILRWTGLGHNLLVTNKKMWDELKRRVNLLLEKGEKRAQFLRLLTAGSAEAKMKKDGTVELPDYLGKWIGKGKLNYEKNDWGIVVSAEKGASGINKTKL